MADEFADIDETLDQLGRDGVKKSSDQHGSVEHYSLKELREEAARRAAATAATKPAFGIRCTKLVPPGTG